jgi:hypothetical protein
VFSTLRTGIDGLDAILAGGIRYPTDSAAFVFLTGGPGSGKTVLALELVARAWLGGPDGSTCLFYSVEHTPESLHRKLEHDFGYYGYDARVEVMEPEIPGRLCLEAHTPNGTTRLLLTQAELAGARDDRPPGTVVDADWIQTEVGNYGLAGAVQMVCVDNVGLLLSDLDYFEKRSALIATRRALLDSQIHGIFVQEVADTRSRRTPSAEELSTDLLLELGFHDQKGSFKARTLEITKARHQYYYRGVHHFSIAGRDTSQQERVLGARSERGPGIHIYPSVAAQLSMARDMANFAVPPRGDEPCDLGHPDLLAAFEENTGPALRSSTILLAEAGTRYTYLGLRFLAAGRRAGETTLIVSTKEDEDALARICAREPSLAPCLAGDGTRRFHPEFRVLYLHPEFVNAGKFLWDLMRATEPGGPDGQPVTRLLFDSIYRLEDRFPLLHDQRFMIPALLDMLRYRGITPFFVDLVPPASGQGGVQAIDPAAHMINFDNVFHVFLKLQDETEKPMLRVLKSATNAFRRGAFDLDYAKT